MRILIVTPWFPTTALPHSGVFVVRDAVALSGRHSVRVIHLVSPQHLGPDPRSARVRDIPVTRVPMSRANPLHWLRAARTVRAAARAADVVHTQAISGLLPFALARPSRTAAWVHTEHWSALTTPGTLPRWARPFIRPISRLLARPDVVTAVCERLAAPIRAVRTGPVRVIGCVVAAPAGLVDLAPQPGPLALVGVGALVPRKGPLMAVRTVAELVDRGVDARLTWVGDGPQRADAVALARDLGVGERLTLTGSLDDAGVRARLDAARLMLIPTLGDNFCTVVAEALSHGRPVVSGIETGASEYTAPAVGAFVADQTPGAYADAVQAVLASTSKMSAADVAATLGDQFWPANVAGAYTRIYEDVVGGALRPAPGGTHAK
ncbi:glycosyltransferase [Rarobacter incanus]|uniref:glycosyltransferase n=1 Tax=Rarobacter incanus TaxID=153494 RepID=UPI001476E932|nr:glycosyltransferase [Rarobacter incanus]